MLEKLSFGSNAFTNGSWTIGGAIRAIASFGYKAVNILADEPLVWPPNNPYHIKRIKKALKETGLIASGINGFTAAGHYGKRDKPPGQDFGPSFADADPALRALKIKYCNATVDLAVELECENISISSGYAPDGISKEEAWDFMCQAIAEALEYAAQYGVNLNIEFEPKLLIATTNDAAALLLDLFSPNLGVNFDIGHSFCVGENVAKSIRDLGAAINGADIEDIALYKGKPTHFHMVPGEGDMPLADVFKAFKKTGFEERGFYTVELYSQSSRPVEAARLSMEYFRRLDEALN